MKANETRTIVRDHYAKVATRGSSAGCAPGCCDMLNDKASAALGYTTTDSAAAPEGADLGLGCGNPTAIASLRTGEVVLDLGSGAGFDCFIAAKQVGPTGRVIGVDMTAEMIARARGNAAKVNATNVEFRLGEIEHLPVADDSVDVVMSNCVVNLSPDKPAVYREAFRVLRSGGRIAIADVLARAPLSDEHRADLALLVGCIGGAATVGEVTHMLEAAGFVDVAIKQADGSKALTESWAPGHPAAAAVFSASVEARKP